MAPIEEPRPRLIPLPEPPPWMPNVGPAEALSWAPGPSTCFGEVLEARRSERLLGPISRSSIGTLLWYGARVRSTNRGQHRAAPSGGGLHPIQWLLLEPPFEEVRLYDPICHATRQILGIDSLALSSAATAVREVLPSARGVLIMALADFQRAASYYEHAESIVWRDAGAAIATLHLTASWLSLGSCVLGVRGVEIRALVCPDGRVDPVGAIVVGQLSRR